MKKRRPPKTQSSIQAVRYKINHKKRFPFWILILILIIFIGLMLGQSKYLVIQAVEIKHSDAQNVNNYLISNEEVGEIISDLKKEKFLLFFPKNTLLLLNNQQVKNKLLADSRINSIKISRHWLERTIKIIVSESLPKAQLSILGDKDYYLDMNGQIIQSIPQNILRPLTDPNNNIYIISVSNLSLIFDKTTSIWGSVSLSEAIKNALKALKTLDKKQDGISIISMEISENNGIFEAKATTDRGWHIFLLLNDQIEQQMANLKLVLNNNKDSQIEYIDLRFGNKIFYK